MLLAPYNSLGIGKVRGRRADLISSTPLLSNCTTISYYCSTQLERGLENFGHNMLRLTMLHGPVMSNLRISTANSSKFTEVWTDDGDTQSECKIGFQGKEALCARTTEQK